MAENKEDKLAVERFHALRKKRQQLLALEPKEAMERILDDPQAAALVHSFPEQDFYYLMHDLGPGDSLPLLSLASKRQWEYVLDLESWQKDRIDIKSVSHWFSLLFEADSKRFVRWFLEDKLEFVEFYLFKNIEVRVREHDQDPADFDNDFFSFDNTYFIRFLDLPINNEADEFIGEQRKKFLTKFFERLSALDHHLFQNILLESTHVLPAESEENSYHWRNVRLAEKGFLPFDESIGIYQPVRPQDIEKQSAKSMPSATDQVSLLPVPQYQLRMLQGDNHFTRAMAAVGNPDILPQLQYEFANLCNRIIVADHRTIRDREELRDIVKKASGYVSIGLERLSGEKAKTDPRRAAALIAKYPLLQIFRVGFGGALELKWRAEKWLDTCWFAQAGLRLTFWGEQWLGVLGGLLLKKPLFYDNYKTGVLYREFASLEDIYDMEDILNQAKAVDDLLSLMSFELDAPSSYGFLTYKNLILTLWAGNYLGLPDTRLSPLALKEVKPFFKELLPDRKGVDQDQPRSIPQAMKNHFLHWLTTETGLRDSEITERLGKTLENLFEEVENELGRVAFKNIDPRFVQLFLLMKGKV
jgi:hypothetical protein